MNRIHAILIAMTQGLNAAAGGNPDQTYSGRTALAARKGGYSAVVREACIDLLFAAIRGQRHHCESSIEWDEVKGIFHG